MRERLVPVRTVFFILSTFLVMAWVACATGPDEPISARVAVIDVQIADDRDKVEEITVRMDDGEVISMSLGDDIDTSFWAPTHLRGHMQSASFGATIGVTYIETPDGFVAIELSE